MKKDSEFAHKLIRILVIICFVMVFCFALVGFLSCRNTDFYKGEGQLYKGTWYWEKTDGTTEEFTFPTSLDAAEGEEVRFYTILPDNVGSGMYMIIQSGRNCKAYIDDTLIYTFEHHEWFSGDIVKSIYIPIKLPDNCAGKKLTIVRDEPDVPNGNMNEVYLGDLFTALSYASHSKGGLFALGIFLAIISLLTIIIFATLSHTYSRHFPIIYLAMGILACASWMVLDSKMFQFTFNSYYFDGVTAYMLILLIPCPFCHYLDHVQERRYQTVYDILQLILIAAFIFFSFMHFTSIASYEQMLFPIDALEALVIAAIFFLVIYDIRHVTPCSYKPVAIGLGTFIIMAIIEITFITLSLNNTFNCEGVFVILGLYILLGGSIIDQINHLRSIEQETQEALAANKAKTTFLANMSHEIRTPINAIMGLNELITRQTDDPVVRGYSSDLADASSNLLELVNDILDFSKIEAGKMEIINEDYHITELVHSINTMLEFKAEAKGLKLITSISPTLPSVLCGDDKHLGEIMINILNNAVKYTEKGSIKFNIGGYQNASDDFFLKVTVEDTGIGIRQEDIPHLFMEFERFDLNRNRNIEGTGLGLAITKKLVSMMGGTISVTSEYGKGSVFTVEVPQTVVSSEKIGDYRAEHAETDRENTDPVSEFVSPGSRILIVDDNKMNLTVSKGLLKDTQVNITTASSGEQMLKMITRFHYDIIFLDHMMPGMDGVETLHRAAALEDSLCKDTPVIVLTANAIVGAKEEYIKEGFTDYLSKPVQSRDLINMLIKYLH